MKTYIVTGAGSGLGKELAFLLAKQGWHVLLVGRSPEKLEKVKEEIEEAGGAADMLPLDVSVGSSIPEKIGAAIKDRNLFGLVNNAGIGHFGPFSKMDDRVIEEMICTNTIGTILMTKAVLPYLEENGAGHIVNIISTAGLRAKVNEAVYVASKFAVRGFTESLQKEYEGTGIKFTAAYMGGMDTPFWEKSGHVADPSKFRSPGEVAEIIIGKMNDSEIVIESKKP